MAAHGRAVSRPQMKNKYLIRFARRGAVLFGDFFLGMQEKVTRAQTARSTPLNQLRIPG